jgi:single-stranded-DNA-specific exonuclease
LIHQIKKQTLDITDVVFYHCTANKCRRTHQARQSCCGIVNRIYFEQAQQFASEIEQYNSDRTKANHKKEVYCKLKIMKKERFTTVGTRKTGTKQLSIVASID